MQNTERSEIRTSLFVSNILTNNDEFYHRESDPLRTSEEKLERGGKLLQHTCSCTVMGN
jgi:hypothetical protein